MVGRVLSRTQISHGQAEGRLPILNGDMHTVVSNYFGGDCSDGNRLQLEQWPFCHIVTYSLAVIGTVIVVRIFLENDKVLAP